MTVVRLELKYATGSCDPFQVMACLLQSDQAFGEEYPPRTVHSLYFDTRSFCSFADHVDGLGKRAKVRLRWYDELADGLAAIEIKRRVGKMTSKTVFPFRLAGRDPEDLQGLAELARVPECERQGLAFVELVPSVQVSYERRYFVAASGVRLTLDYEMRTPTRPLTTEVLAEVKAARGQESFARGCADAFGWLLTKNSKYVNALSLEMGLGHSASSAR